MPENCKLCGRFVKNGEHYCNVGCQEFDETILGAAVEVAYYYQIIIPKYRQEIREMDITIIWRNGNGELIKPESREIKKFRFAFELFDWLVENTSPNYNIVFNKEKQTIDIMV